MVNGNHVVLGNSVEAESPRALVRRCVVQGCTLRGEGTVSPLDGGLGVARGPGWGTVSPLDGAWAPPGHPLKQGNGLRVLLITL